MSVVVSRGKVSNIKVTQPELVSSGLRHKKQPIVHKFAYYKFHAEFKPTVFALLT